MQTQFKFTHRLICTPEYINTPEDIYTRVSLRMRIGLYGRGPTQLQIMIRAVAGQRSSSDLCFATNSFKTYDPLH